ncbi:MAG: hypothetical protein H0T58_01735 [Gemmatimonadales bacterium]|nr:hypothetical protein [Gemmatimonadales bacterium]
MTKQRWLGTVLVLTACGGGTGAPAAEPASSSSGAVRSFMQAVADSNIDRMASLWGTAAGPASKTRQPPDYQRRVTIMQAYLRNQSFRITSDVPQPDESRRALQVEIKRNTCTWSVPFVAIKAANGTWLVTQVDLAAAGNPARPCDEEGAAADSAP